MYLENKIQHLITDFDNERAAMNERYKSLEEKYNIISNFEEEKVVEWTRSNSYNENRRIC